MDLIRDVLDNQLVDRNQNKIGKADGIILELRDNQPPRLAYIEVGMPTLMGRLHPRLQRWIIALEQKWGAKHSEPLRIPWSKVLDVGIDVDVDLEGEATTALTWEKWLRENVISKIPGGG